jgi:hypothetical protein
LPVSTKIITVDLKTSECVLKVIINDTLHIIAILVKDQFYQVIISTGGFTYCGYTIPITSYIFLTINISGAK